MPSFALAHRLKGASSKRKLKADGRYRDGNTKEI